VSGRVEIADGDRGGGVFPASWGRPPGTPYSEQRARWVRQHIPLSPRVAQRRLAARDRQLLWRLRLLELEWKRPTP